MRTLKRVIEHKAEGCFRKVLVTGHSLGGAAATLFSLYLGTTNEAPYDKLRSMGQGLQLITFGSPLVGQADFKAAYARANIPTKRIVSYANLHQGSTSDDDPVTWVGKRGGVHIDDGVCGVVDSKVCEVRLSTHKLMRQKAHDEKGERLALDWLDAKSRHRMGVGYMTGMAWYLGKSKAEFESSCDYLEEQPEYLKRDLQPSSCDPNDCKAFSCTVLCGNAGDTDKATKRGKCRSIQGCKVKEDKVGFTCKCQDNSIAVTARSPLFKDLLWSTRASEWAATHANQQQGLH